MIPEREERQNIDMAKSTIEVLQGDITRLEMDAIVNAANSSLLGGGGVSSGLSREAAPEQRDS